MSAQDKQKQKRWWYGDKRSPLSWNENPDLDEWWIDPFMHGRHAVVTGTATASIDEDDITAGGKTIIITLTDEEWVASGATFNAVRQDIIDGLDSAQSETNGWNNEVRDKEVVGAVVRTSDTVVTITLTASASYDITAQETITVTVPASAVIENRAIVATPTFTVDEVGAPAVTVPDNLMMLGMT